jgi:hypothetical protein
MADSRVKELLRIGNKLFGDKEQIDSLWEELALNFYPERADFTSTRYEGEEYADHLYSSVPILARRELGNLVASSLRPRAKKWFSIHTNDEELAVNSEEAQYLEMMSEIQWRAVYEPKAQFTRATKQADHDFVTFGNAVVWFGLNTFGDSLLFRNFHLRDCAWAEGYEGKVDQIHRKWEPTAWQLKEMFGDQVSATVKKCCEKEPHKKFECRHMVVPSDLYEYKSARGKTYEYVSVVMEVETENVLETSGLNYFPYVIPRWQTMAGSAYGVSMATMVLLPDGRTVQSVMRTLRQAGEKYVEPPMIAVADAIRGDVSTYPGGITTADMEYDERLGEVLRPITQDRGGMPIGFDIAGALQEDINKGFFLDKVQLPAFDTKEMTAFEVQTRISEHIRSAAPIFEPIEQEYSAPLMDGVFNLLKDQGAFPLDAMPESLMGQDIKFSFNSPLSEMADQGDTEKYLNVVNNILAPLSELAPEQLENADMTTATRDAMRAAGWKAKWFKPEEAVEQAAEQMAQAKQAQEQMMQAQMMGQAAEQGGKGIQEVKKAGEGEI